MSQNHKNGTYDELIEELRKESKSVNFFLINIDNFSNINSAYGYEIGTEVLNEVIKYLELCKPENAKLYNFYSDKFVFIDERYLNENEVKSIAEAILSFFSQLEFFVHGIEMRISLSIGISQDKGLINISQAETAIDELRKAKRHHFYIFDENSEYVQNQKRNIHWILKIKEAVENEDILAYFQPIVNNTTGRVEKYECLARLKDADEIISPYYFLDAARVTGNLSYVTRSLIMQSFKKFSGTNYEFSINIAASDFLLDYLEFFLLKNAKKYNIDPSKVVLEMLEDITTLDKGTTLQQLNSLREKGFKLAIDDFGAENSNLSRLLEIHPDYLKIDGQFIKNIVTDKKSQIIVDGIVAICKKSDIKIIAEYVHDKEVQDKIESLGIEYSQGYYFGKPKAELLENEKVF
ncbi:MAG: EAL domain-containing protein [Campylobacterales bacterium]|nr:EAL domain-containing protein [Campylobacterales bacterium]